MTPEEFNSRVKDTHKVSESIYTTEIEPLYYMAGDMDKDTFCKVWDKVIAPTQLEEVKFDDFNIFGKFAEYFHKSQENIKTLNKTLKNEIAERDTKIAKLQDIMIRNGLEESTGLRTAEIIKRKIALGIQLTDDQLQYIMNNL